VAVGDFNGDGICDLAVANESSNSVSVLLGNGDGTFQDAVNYPVVFANAVMVGDFNGDGVPDLAVATGGPASGVEILLGQGDGTFQDAGTNPAGKSPWAGAVGDFNGDGFLDIAVVDYQNYGTVTVLLNAADWDQGAPTPRTHSHASAFHSSASRSLSLDPLSAQKTAHESFALGQLSPLAADLTLKPEPPVLMPTMAVQDARAEGTSAPIPLVSVQNAHDAVFLGWSDPLVEALIWNWVPLSR
jgi:hypothetical protein